MATSLENYLSVEIGCLKFVDSYRFDAKLDELSTTIIYFQNLEGNGKKTTYLKRN